MNNLINVTLNENQEPVVSARDLHKELKIKTRFSQWVDQNFKAFEENYDFSSVVITTQQNHNLFRLVAKIDLNGLKTILKTFDKK